MYKQERALQVNYDLRKPGRNYDDLYRYLRSFNGYWPLLESMWVVRTTKTVEEVATDVRRLTDQNDKIVVIDVTGDAWWTYGMPADALKWMHGHMGAVVKSA